jgi:hypothetical protein
MRAQPGILGFCWIDTAAVDGGPTPTMTVRERCLWVRPKGRLVLLDRLASRHSDLTAGTRSLRNLRDFAAKRVLGNLSEAKGRNIIHDRAADLPDQLGLPTPQLSARIWCGTCEAAGLVPATLT